MHCARSVARRIAATTSSSSTDLPSMYHYQENVIGFRKRLEEVPLSNSTSSRSSAGTSPSSNREPSEPSSQLIARIPTRSTTPVKPDSRPIGA